jgi:hypothetical protein
MYLCIAFAMTALHIGVLQNPRKNLVWEAEVACFVRRLMITLVSRLRHPVIEK